MIRKGRAGRDARWSQAADAVDSFVPTEGAFIPSGEAFIRSSSTGPLSFVIFPTQSETKHILCFDGSSSIDRGVALLFLASAPDDPPSASREYQRELGDLLHSLRASGVVVSARYAADGGVGLSATFVIRSASLGSAFETVIQEWIKSCYGRKAQLRIGNSEVEAQTAEEVAMLLKHAREYQKTSR